MRLGYRSNTLNGLGVWEICDNPNCSPRVHSIHKIQPKPDKSRSADEK